MRHSSKLGLAALSLLFVLPAAAQNEKDKAAGEAYTFTVTPPDPAAPDVSGTNVTKPEAGHIPFSLPKNIKWSTSGSSGEHQALLFGDPDKPGPYGVLTRWDPGHNSTPHFHTTDRDIYVISGTWWVSSSTHYDRSKMYPLPAGSFAVDTANTVHWDGAKVSTGAALILITGMGPMKTNHFVPSAPDSLDYKPAPMK